MGILGFPDLRLFQTETQTIAEANQGGRGRQVPLLRNEVPHPAIVWAVGNSPSSSQSQVKCPGGHDFVIESWITRCHCFKPRYNSLVKSTASYKGSGSFLNKHRNQSPLIALINLNNATLVIPW